MRYHNQFMSFLHYCVTVATIMALRNKLFLLNTQKFKSSKIAAEKIGNKRVISNGKLNPSKVLNLTPA